MKDVQIGYYIENAKNQKNGTELPLTERAYQEGACAFEMTNSHSGADILSTEL